MLRTVSSKQTLITSVFYLHPQNLVVERRKRAAIHRIRCRSFTRKEKPINRNRLMEEESVSTRVITLPRRAFGSLLTLSNATSSAFSLRSCRSHISRTMIPIRIVMLGFQYWPLISVLLAFYMLLILSIVLVIVLEMQVIANVSIASAKRYRSLEYRSLSSLEYFPISSS